MKYVLICPLFCEMIVGGRLFVFLGVLTEQNTKLTTLCLFPTFFSGGGRGSCHICQIQKSQRHPVRLKLNNPNFPMCGCRGRGDDFPFLTSCEVWVSIIWTFGFIIYHGRIRMGMKPASWEERDHCGVVSRSILLTVVHVFVGPGFAGSLIAGVSLPLHTSSLSGIQISPSTFARLGWILEPRFSCQSAFVHRVLGTLGCGLASPHSAW